MALQSLLPRASTSTKHKKKSIFFTPQLCDIAEDKTLQTHLPNQSISTSLKSILLHETDIKLNPKAKEFIPLFVQPKPPNITYKKLQIFIPKHKPRAKLNIYIGKSQTKKFLSYLNESFPNSSTMYFYLDVSTAFQMHDKQMYIYETQKRAQISFINFDLHKKETNELLYGIIIPNDKNRIQKCNQNNNINNTKWLWKLETFSTANEIYKTYGIHATDLPKSSLEIHGLQEYILKENGENINSDILDNIDWKQIQKNIQQIGKINVKKSSKIKQLKVEFTNANFIEKCKESWNNFAAIPIIAYENKDITGFNYWVEWVKLVKVKVDDKNSESYIGISFKKMDNQWKLQSIFLDKSDMLNKHRLFGCVPSSYMEYFNKFNILITAIKWV